MLEYTLRNYILELLESYNKLTIEKADDQIRSSAFL